MVPCRSPEWKKKAHYCSPTALLSLARPSGEYCTEGLRDTPIRPLPPRKGAQQNIGSRRLASWSFRLTLDDDPVPIESDWTFPSKELAEEQVNYTLDSPALRIAGGWTSRTER